MNAETFVAALHQLLLVEHLEMYRNQLVAANYQWDLQGLELDLGEGTESEAFLASLDEQQQRRYLNEVRSVIAATATTILAVLDAENPLGKKRVEFSLVPKGGENIAGGLSDLFVEAEMISRPEDPSAEGVAVVPSDEPAADIVSPGAGAVPEDVPVDEETADDDLEPMDAEEFIDRVREVLFDETLPMLAEMGEEIAQHADDPSAQGYGSPEFTFLAGLDDNQRAAHVIQLRNAMHATGAYILGILDGATATRNDYLEFSLIPPGGENNIAGDLQELFFIADEDGPIGA